MINNLQPHSGIAYRLTVIGKWWVGLVAFFFVLGTAIAVAIALFRFLRGNPEWQGIVMVPEVFIFSILLCLPGVAIFVLGRLLMRQ